MSTFRVGQKVVCVKTSSAPLDYEERIKGVVYPKIGLEYTIREIVIGDSYAFGFRLEEIINPKCNYMQGFAECIFNADYFRPLEELSNTTYDEVMQWIESGKPIEILN